MPEFSEEREIQNALEEGTAPNWKYTGGRPPQLAPANAHIWDFYLLCKSQFVYDFHALPLVMECMGVMRMTEEKARYFIEGLIGVHHIVSKAERDREAAKAKRGR